MNHLLPGLRKFSEKVFPKQQEHFQTLSQGQKPHTLMITCADSRIDPSLVTQTKPGELFVVRNAGNIIPPYGMSSGGEEAAIQFAVDGLGVSNVVICGHTQCGAMAALAGNLNLDHIPSVKVWLTHAEKTKSRMGALDQSLVNLGRFAEENVLVQAENLKTHPAIANAIAEGRIHLFAWVYNFQNGLVTVYDPRLKRFIPTSEINEEQEGDGARFAL